MSAPNIEMIASLMRSCSLGSRVRRPPPPAPAPPPPPPPPQNRLQDLTDEDEGVMVELNSEVALPYHWEQCLDMRTGEVYYINWKDGTRTTEDPRTSTALAAATYYTSEDDESSDDDESSNDCHNAGEDSGDTTSYSSGVSSLSSPSPRETLVAAGCKSCFMYFMVPKLVEDCPKCGGGLLHLGRNGCF